MHARDYEELGRLVTQMPPGWELLRLANGTWMLVTSLSPLDSIRMGGHLGDLLHRALDEYRAEMVGKGEMPEEV